MPEPETGRFMTSPSHGRGPESESQRAHPDSLIMTRNGFDSENASFIRVSMTLKALLPLFLSNEMGSFDKVR